MEAWPTLTEAIIQQNATPESYKRGYGYYEQGAVLTIVRRGQQLEAEVAGSQYVPYQVGITFDTDGIRSATCTCPYDWGGWCKHIVATLLTCLHQPETIETRQPLEELLAGLDREQLRALLLNLASHIPNLVGAIESQLALLQAAPAAPGAVQVATPSARQTLVDPQPIRRQVRAILHSLDHMRQFEAYWHVDNTVNDVRQLLKQAQDLTARGDGRNALAVLETITDEYVDGWTCLDDSDGYASGFFEDLEPAWTEAILSADLAPAERRQWAQKLARWQREIRDYGMDDVFETAQAAAKHGWDYAPLQRVLQGEVTTQGAWEGEAPWYADDLAIARLQVLERQERFQEYLYLAQAEGRIGLYVTMLTRLGRVREAVDEGLKHLATTDEALMVAQALRKREELAAALRIAEHGLTLDGSKGPLATWLRDLASDMGDTERALQAAMTAFRVESSLDAYLKVQKLAGERWPGLQTELLDHLRQTTSNVPQAHVDIFLHEGLLDEAIAAVGESASYGLLERVMDAAIDYRPDWVIQAACQQAERIMDSGKSKHYGYAISRLERAHKAYLSAGRQAEWRAYLRGIRTRYRRKYSLMEMLQRLEE